MEENTSNIETPQGNTDNVNTDQQEHNTTDENENIDRNIPEIELVIAKKIVSEFIQE